MGSTGAVITSAGLIFAASMFGLTFASITTMVQIGFIIGVGILLDTFLVRTITVPAVAALVGQANWWPSRLRPQVHTPVRRAERASTSRRLKSGGHGQKTQVGVSPSTANRRHRAQEIHEDLAPHALPLFGPAAALGRVAANAPEPVVDNQIATLGERLAHTNGQSSLETNSKQPVETNGQHPPDTNGNKPLSTPPVDASSEDEQVNELASVGRWPTSDATFPVGVDNDDQLPMTPPAAVSSIVASRRHGHELRFR